MLKKISPNFQSRSNCSVCPSFCQAVGGSQHKPLLNCLQLQVLSSRPWLSRRVKQTRILTRGCGRHVWHVWALIRWVTFMTSSVAFWSEAGIFHGRVTVLTKPCLAASDFFPPPTVDPGCVSTDVSITGGQWHPSGISKVIFGLRDPQIGPWTSRGLHMWLWKLLN